MISVGTTDMAQVEQRQTISPTKNKVCLLQYFPAEDLITTSCRQKAVSDSMTSPSLIYISLKETTPLSICRVYHIFFLTAPVSPCTGDPPETWRVAVMAREAAVLYGRSGRMLSTERRAIPELVGPGGYPDPTPYGFLTHLPLP